MIKFYKGDENRFQVNGIWYVPVNDNCSKCAKCAFCKESLTFCVENTPNCNDIDRKDNKNVYYVKDENQNS